MTVGIGVLATDDKFAPAKPNTIVLIADTKGTYGDEFSHERLHKLFEDHEAGLCATAADRIDNAAELFPMIVRHIKLIPPNERSYGTMLAAISMASYLYKRSKFCVDVLPSLRIPPNQFDRFGSGFAVQGVPQHIDKEIQDAWQAYRIRCDLIVGAFDKDKRAYLYMVSGSDESTESTEGSNFPGYAVIGSGGGNAQFWLCRRGHNLGMDLKKAAYHAYEAKRMAESTPTVNDHLDCLIFQHEQTWSISSHKKDAPPADYPITIEWLKEAFDKYGPRSTANLE